MSESTIAPGESLVLWIQQALQQGVAVEKSDRIELAPEYLETVGHQQTGDVLSLDVGSEGVWLSNAVIYKHGERLVFELYEKLHFVLPVERGEFASTRHLLLHQHEKPISPPLPIREWDKKHRLPQCFDRPFFYVSGPI